MVGDIATVVLVLATFFGSPWLASNPDHTGLYIYCRVFCAITSFFNLWALFCNVNWGVWLQLRKSFQFWYLQVNALLAFGCLGITCVDAGLWDWSLAVFYTFHGFLLMQKIMHADAVQTRRVNKLANGSLTVLFSCLILVWVSLDPRVFTGKCFKIPWLGDQTIPSANNNATTDSSNRDGSICSGVVGRSAFFNTVVFQLKLLMMMVTSTPGTCIILSQTIEFVRDKTKGRPGRAARIAHATASATNDPEGLT